jgi:hypothetical protein
MQQVYQLEENSSITLTLLCLEPGKKNVTTSISLIDISFHTEEFV